MVIKMKILHFVDKIDSTCHVYHQILLPLAKNAMRLLKTDYIYRIFSWGTRKSLGYRQVRAGK